jgi:hypothetical protein
MNMKSIMTLITRNSDSRLAAAQREPVLIPGMMLLAFAILFSQVLSASVNGSSWEEIEALRKNHLYSPQKKQQLFDWLKSEGIEDINAFIKKSANNYRSLRREDFETSHGIFALTPLPRFANLRFKGPQSPLYAPRRQLEAKA